MAYVKKNILQKALIILAAVLIQPVGIILILVLISLPDYIADKYNANHIVIASYYEPQFCKDTITVRKYYLPGQYDCAVIHIGGSDSISIERIEDIYTRLYRHLDNDTINVRNIVTDDRRGPINYTLSPRFKVIKPFYDNPRDYNNSKKEKVDPYFYFIIDASDCWVNYPDPNDPYKQISRKAHCISKRRIRVNNNHS